MSLVGPRPVLPEELAIYRHSGALDTYLEVRPGMSGLWQVSGRSRLDQATRVRVDKHYVQHRSFWYYLVMVVCTPVAVLRRDGAF
jgi:lipopolysaccharide/colanic/teichoic acid biosynthesis glycosyltransferase